MATFKISILKHQEREDKKFPVSIRVTNNRKSAYIPTGNYVVRGQLSSDFELVDKVLYRKLDAHIEKYEKIIREQLGMRVRSMTVYELCDYLEKQTSDGVVIDFVAFSKKHIEQLKDKSSDSSYAKSFETTLASLIDFFGRDVISIKEISSKNLQRYADYLKTERTIIRKDQYGRDTATTRKGVSDRTVALYLTNIRTLFNQARDYYNDEETDISLITHYPFKKLKIERTPEPEKRSLPIETIRQIRDFPDIEHDYRIKTLPLGRDVFMLSFYLVGMNTVDLYEIDTYENGRISYNRRKTKRRRSDHAFTSIKVEPEVKVLLEKYRDPSGKRVFIFYKLYSDYKIFRNAVNDGLAQISERLEIGEKVTSYYARHSWASIARNKCGINKDDIHFALNHVDQGLKITDVYIEKDWSLIDKANRKVLNYLKGKKKEIPAKK